MTKPDINPDQAPLDRRHAGALHEAGHAVIAVLLGRALCELSIEHDSMGEGYVRRELREGTPEEILEEILIARAGARAPEHYENWITNEDHDQHRIDQLVVKCPELVAFGMKEQWACLDPVLDLCRPCVEALARTLFEQRKMAGKDALVLIRSKLPSTSEARDRLAVCTERFAAMRNGPVD